MRATFGGCCTFSRTNISTDAQQQIENRGDDSRVEASLPFTEILAVGENLGEIKRGSGLPPAFRLRHCRHAAAEHELVALLHGQYPPPSNPTPKRIHLHVSQVHIPDDHHVGHNNELVVFHPLSAPDRALTTIAVGC
jgi:hypothetical protein